MFAAWAGIAIVDEAEYLLRRSERTRAERMSGYARDEIRPVRTGRREPTHADFCSRSTGPRRGSPGAVECPLQSIAPRSGLRYLADLEAAEASGGTNGGWTVVRSRVAKHPNAGDGLRAEMDQPGTL